MDAKEFVKTYNLPVSTMVELPDGKWTFLYSILESYATTSTTRPGIHNPEICGCENHSDYCPYNPSSPEYTGNSQSETRPTLEDIEKELLDRWGFHEDGSILPGEQLKIFSFMGWYKGLLSNGDSEGEEKVEVYSREECVFEYCSAPEICRSKEKCQHH